MSELTHLNINVFMLPSAVLASSIEKATVVLIDTLRMTTSAITALTNGILEFTQLVMWKQCENMQCK
jgi:hypothetical protein